MSVYSMAARGPASQKYAEILLEECTNFWMAGRQMCEELSLTGNHCINRKHLLTFSGENSEKMAVMPHQSNLNFVSACNCGKKQGAREDPYNLLQANFTFYNDLESECCHDLERTLVPYQQNVEGQELANLLQANKKKAVHWMMTKDVTDEDILPAFPSWSLVHLGSSTIYSHSSGNYVVTFSAARVALMLSSSNNKAAAKR